jgi:two-component system LytT family sensor kinase
MIKTPLYSRRYYIIFSIIFFVFWFLFKLGGIPHVDKALESTTGDVAVAIIALLITVDVLLPKLLYKNKFFLFIAAFALLVFFWGSVIILFQLWLFDSSLFDYEANMARHPEHYFYWFWADLIFGSYFLVFFISSAGAAMRFAIDRLTNISTIEKLEKEKLNAELDSLKNQINPHFLFNALNTIYYKIEKSNQPARETLQLFSGMLRYQLYDCNQQYIPIENELHFLRSYIDLQKERMNAYNKVSYNDFDEIKGFNISPFLLMPIIENCFKHVADDSKTDNHIDIEIKADDDFFYLFTSNDERQDNIEAEEGIGLKNIKKRLNLIYPGKHELQTRSSGGRFEVNLKIKF